MFRVFAKEWGWITLTPFSVDDDGNPKNLAGTQAIIFRVAEYADILAKIYSAGQAPDHLEAVIEHLKLSLADVDTVVKLHGTILERPGTAPIGFLMEAVDSMLLADTRFRTTFARLLYAERLARTFDQVSARHVFPADTHEGNWFRVGNSPLGIDIDSWCSSPFLWPDGRYERFVSGVDNPYTIAPENRGKDKPDLVYDAFTISHSLAVLLYRVLKDVHPALVLTNDGRPLDVPSRIQAGSWGRFDPGFDVRTGRLDLNKTVPDWGIPWRKLPQDIQHFFTLTFTRGLSHREIRPLVADWYQALRDWRMSRLRTVGLITGLATVGVLALRPWTVEFSRFSTTSGLSARSAKGESGTSRP